MDILDPAKFVDMALYGRAVFQGPGDGSGVQALQSDTEDGLVNEPVPNGPVPVVVGDHWELTIDSVQLTSPKRYAGVVGATGAVGQLPRWAAGFPKPPPETEPPPLGRAGAKGKAEPEPKLPPRKR